MTRQALRVATRPAVRLGVCVLVAVVLAASVGCADRTERQTRDAVPQDCGPALEPVRLVPEVIDERPHDPTAFTQGLLLADGVLYESTGLVGASSVRAVEQTTGEVLRSSDLDAESFGEGLTASGEDRLVQLTWKEGRALLWDREHLNLLGEHRYDGEGWGITTLDDGRFLMSDGSDTLTVRDPEDFSVLDRWVLERRGGAADRLNELEWDGEHVWANRWKTDEIVRIDPRCRRVDGVVDASDLTRRAAALAAAGAGSAEGAERIDVLNGIARQPGTDRFLVTGKRWPVLFEVRFVPAG